MILIALGGNLPASDGSSPVRTCMQALEALKMLETLDFVAVSYWYRSRPLPPDPAQPDYCNGVARFAGAPDPAALLDELHRIEATFGRRRSIRNAARTVDLDLIDLNGLVRDAPPPVLPHPRAHERTFVLRPVLDVAPDWVHPLFGRSVGALLAELPASAGEGMTCW